MYLPEEESLRSVPTMPLRGHKRGCGITRECVTNQRITNCHLSSELFTAPRSNVTHRAPWERAVTAL